jgi:integrase
MTADLLKHLSKTRKEQGMTVVKTESELLAEARRKVRYRQAVVLAPRYSLYALRHSWATNALERGIDALTVAVLMGHSDPSTLARVYQHLSHNPKHLLEQARRATG